MSIFSHFVFAMIFSFTSCIREKGNAKVNPNSQLAKSATAIEELTLHDLPNDTNSLCLRKSDPTGLYEIYYIRDIKKNEYNERSKIIAMYIRFDPKQNQNSPQSFYDSMKAISYDVYCIELDRPEWAKIKKEAFSMQSIVDANSVNTGCEFCTNYTLDFNGRRVQEKVVKNSDVKILYNYVSANYRDRLLNSRKSD